MGKLVKSWCPDEPVDSYQSGGPAPAVWDDFGSDETEGRALYRAKADALARAQVNVAKRGVKLNAAIAKASVGQRED